MKRFGRLVVAIGAITLFAHGTPAEGRTVPFSAFAPTRALETRYVYAGGAAQRQAIERAVEDVVSEMLPLIRSVARKRLLESNGILESLEFSLSGDPLALKYIGDRIIEAPRSGKAVPWKDENGDPVRVSLRLQGTTLVQQLSDNRGSRRNTYVFGPDGKLTMHVRIESSMMPKPLEYSLTYKKAA